VWRNNQATGATLELSRWLVVACGFIFFAFFGFADEALKQYKIAFGSIARFSTSRLLAKLGTPNSSTASYEKFPFGLPFDQKCLL
jgi:pheromone a factor receptor